MSDENPYTPKRSLRPSEIPSTNPEMLARYVTDTGKILPRRLTGLNAKQQRAITKTIKRSRDQLLMK